MRKGNFRHAPHLAGAVYVISDGASLTKVGMSAAPRKRIAALAAANGRHLHLEFLCWVENAREVEQAAHLILWRLRRKGEWFACKSDAAIGAVERAVGRREREVEFDIRPLCESIREATRAALIERELPAW